MAPTAMHQPRDWREARRPRAWELKRQGWQQQTIAAALGVTPGAVSQWLGWSAQQPLPAYAPELNPEEGIWNYLKRVELRNVCCPNLQQLRHALREAAIRLCQKPRVIQGCVREAGYHV